MAEIWGILVQINLFFQSFGDWLIQPLHLITMLGDEEFYLLAMPALYWCIDSRLGIRIGMMLMVSNTLGTSLKFLFHTPRPFWVSEAIIPVVEESSFGMPSGHALNAMALWGYAAVKIPKKWIKILFWVLVFLIGFSRIVMGVHFINDMLLGWIAGAVLLVLFVHFEKKYGTILKNWPVRKKITWIMISTLGMVLLPLLIKGLNSSYQVPAAYLETIRFHFPQFEFNPFSVEGMFTVAGTWMGLLFGVLLLDKQRIQFDARGSLQQKSLRYIVGVIGVLALYLGLKMIFPDGESFVALFFRFIRYTLIGGWVAFGAPLLFKKLKLINL